MAPPVLRAADAHRRPRLPRRRSGEGRRARRGARRAQRSRSSTRTRGRGSRRSTATSRSRRSARRSTGSQVDALLIHAVYLLNARERGPGDPREDADVADRVAATRAPRSARTRSSCTRDRRRRGEVAPGDRARGRGDRRGAGGDRGLRAAPGEHGRRRRHARALVRRAGRAARGRRRRPRLGVCLDSCHLLASGYRRSAPPTALADGARRPATRRSGPAASARCTSTTPRRRWAPTATATRTSARASSGATGCRVFLCEPRFDGPAVRARDARVRTAAARRPTELALCERLRAEGIAARGRLSALRAEAEWFPAPGPAVGRGTARGR